jgi:hypothetical protein
MSRRPKVRRVVTLVASLALLVAAPVVARAADDPEPVDWPTVQAPNTDAKSDPEPIDWPRPQRF